MFEDKLLVWKFKRGSRNALKFIYEKYKNDLFALAIALSNDKASAEDTVHEVFVAFAQLADKFQLKGSLKSYLSTAVANRVRNLSRVRVFTEQGVAMLSSVLKSKQAVEVNIAIMRIILTFLICILNLKSNRSSSSLTFKDP